MFNFQGLFEQNAITKVIIENKNENYSIILFSSIELERANYQMRNQTLFERVRQAGRHRHWMKRMTK